MTITRVEYVKQRQEARRCIENGRSREEVIETLGWFQNYMSDVPKRQQIEGTGDLQRDIRDGLRQDIKKLRSTEELMAAAPDMAYILCKARDRFTATLFRNFALLESCAYEGENALPIE